MIEQYITEQPIEFRDSDTGPRLTGTIVPEGRAARAGRSELWIPGAASWGSEGIAIRAEHRGAELGRAQPVRHANGEIRISTAATPELRAAYDAGRKFLSVEFHSLLEVRTAGGVRELQRAYIEAAALVPNPEYGGTKAEVRSATEVKVWL